MTAAHDGTRRAPLTAERAHRAEEILGRHRYGGHPWLARLALRKLGELYDDAGALFTWEHLAEPDRDLHPHGPRQLVADEAAAWLQREGWEL